jgi:hypothetical protein
MSKYQHANDAIASLLEAGTAEGWDRSELLLALLVAGIAAYRSEAGTDAARDALRYELGELEGATDTQFIRSR